MQWHSRQQDILYTRACKAGHVVEVTHTLLVTSRVCWMSIKCTDTSKTALVCENKVSHLLVRWFIMGWGEGGEPEHCRSNILSWHMDNSRIVTVCCSMSMVSKTLYSHFTYQRSYTASYSHSWTKLHNEVMSWISGAYEYHYAWPLPEVNATTV